MNIQNPLSNIQSFSSYVAGNWNIHPDLLANHIYAVVSAGLAGAISLRKEITIVYEQNRIRFYETAASSGAFSHPALICGRPEDDMHAIQVLGIIISAETDVKLRRKIFKWLQKAFTAAYLSARKSDARPLLKIYTSEREFCESAMAMTDRAVYFYTTLYRSPDSADYTLITSVAKAMVTYEHSLQSKEISGPAPDLQSETSPLYGITGYADISTHPDSEISGPAAIFDNLLRSNGLDPIALFHDHTNIDPKPVVSVYECINKTVSDGCFTKAFHIETAYMQLLIQEYKRSKEIYRKNNDIVLRSQMNKLEEELEHKELENERMQAELEELRQREAGFTERLEKIISEQAKKFDYELSRSQSVIDKLETEIGEEKQYHKELFQLREYLFKAKPDTAADEFSAPLEEIIQSKTIIIIGGTKRWRRKLREQYPQIYTFNGFNQNFNASVLHSASCILFYTDALSHAVYNKAMNCIRANNIPFGYISSTNLAFVEAEIYEGLRNAGVDH